MNRKCIEILAFLLLLFLCTGLLKSILHIHIILAEVVLNKSRLQIIYFFYTVHGLYKHVRHHKGVFTLYIIILFIFYTFKIIYILSYFCFIYFVHFHTLLYFYIHTIKDDSKLIYKSISYCINLLNFTIFLK